MRKKEPLEVARQRLDCIRGANEEQTSESRTNENEQYESAKSYSQAIGMDPPDNVTLSREQLACSPYQCLGYSDKGYSESMPIE